MEKISESLKEAEKRIKKIDHLIYISFPLIQDKKLLLNAIIEINDIIKKCINIILQREYFYKRIKIYKEPKINFKTFEEKCAKRYNIDKQEINLILELFDIAKTHKKSPLEFVKNDRIIILSENSESYCINLEKTRQFLDLGKKIITKIKNIL